MIDISSDKPTGTDCYKRWRNIIDTTLEWRQKKCDNGDQKWIERMALVEGKHWSLEDQMATGFSSGNPRDFITEHESGTDWKLMQSFLVSRPPKFFFKPTKAEEVTSAILQQRNMEYCYERYGMHKQVKLANMDFVGIGHCVMKTGYNLIVNKYAVPDKKGNTEPRDFMIKDAPFIYRVSPFCFLYDYQSYDHSLESARWCAEIIFRDPADVLNDPDYDSKVLSDIRIGRETPGTVASMYTDTKWSTARMEDADKEKIVEIHLLDKTWMKRFIFLKDIDRPLFEGPWQYDYLDSFPYIKADYIPVINKPFGLGITDWIEDQQHQMNRSMTALFQHIRRITGGRYWLDNGLDIDEKKKFKAGDHVIVRPDGSKGGEPIADAPIPTDVYSAISLMRETMRERTGINALMRGQSLGSRKSATETSAIQGFSNLQISSISGNFDDMLIQIARHVTKHCKKNYIMDRIIDIAGPMGEYWGVVNNQAPLTDGKYWVQYSAKDIAGDFDVTIESSSDPMRNKTEFIQTSQNFLNLMLQVSQLSLQGIDLKNVGGVNLLEGIRMVADAMEIKDVARILPELAIIQAPIQTQTAANVGQSPNSNVPTGVPAVQQQAATAGSALAGQGVVQQ